MMCSLNLRLRFLFIMGSLVTLFACDNNDNTNMENTNDDIFKGGKIMPINEEEKDGELEDKMRRDLGDRRYEELKKQADSTLPVIDSNTVVGSKLR